MTWESGQPCNKAADLRHTGTASGTRFQAYSNCFDTIQPLLLYLIQDGFFADAETGAHGTSGIGGRTLRRSRGQQSGQVRRIDRGLAEQTCQPFAFRQTLIWCDEEHGFQAAVLPASGAIAAHRGIAVLDQVP